MKKSMKTFWAVALTLVMLVTLLVSAIPASAGTLAWSKAGMPGATGTNQLVSGSNINQLYVAPTGDVFAVDTAALKIYKTSDGGYTWAAATLPTAASLNITGIGALAISPSYATDATVFAIVTDASGNSYAIRSVNGGASFAQYGGMIDSSAGTAIALDPTYNAGAGIIVAGTATSAYAWGVNGALAWQNLGATALNKAVKAIAFSPNYPLDSTIFAVSANTSNTILNAVITASGTWNPSGPFAGYPVALSSDVATAASIAFPSDFNASINVYRNLYIGTYSGTAANNDVWHVAGATSTDMGLNRNVYSVAFSGTNAAGTLYAGTADGNLLYTTSNPSVAAASIIWSVAPPNNISGTSNGIVALSGSDIYLGTSGSGTSAFNASTDGGANFRQRGLIDAAINTITDLEVVSSSEWYLVTKDTTTNVASLWYTTNGGTQYVRMLASQLTAAGSGALSLSQNFATDHTMYFYERNNPTSPVVLMMSTDAGNTWTPRPVPSPLTGGINQVVAVDQYTMYVSLAGNGVVYKSGNNGWTYTAMNLLNPITLAQATGVNQLKINKASGAILAGAIDGGVYLLAPAATSFTELASSTVNGTAAPVVVAFDANYNTNNTVYAAYTTVGGTFAFVNGTSTAWLPLTGGAVVSAAGDMLDAPDGTLFVSDTAANAGMVRTLVPTSDLVTGVPAPAPQAVTTSLATVAAGATLGQLQWASGSNIIMAVNAAGTNLVSYTDTLSTPIPNVASPANAAVVGGTSVTWVLDPVTGATGYAVQYDTRSDYATGNTLNFTTVPSITAKATSLNPGSTIYYRVRVTTPVAGPWSQSYTVTLQLAGTSISGPQIVTPAILDGSTAQGGFNVPQMASFFWIPVPAATSYEFQLASDSAMTNLVVDATGANALGNVTSYSVTSPLSYGTMYYWRVRAVSATSTSAWSNVQAFSVMAQPTVAPTSTATAGPTITITQPAAPTITFTEPQATSTTITIPAAPATTEVGPAYIWAIIIIGAVLVIAVIVLIVRTRRSV